MSALITAPSLSAAIDVSRRLPDPQLLGIRIEIDVARSLIEILLPLHDVDHGLRRGRIDNLTVRHHSDELGHLPCRALSEPADIVADFLEVDPVVQDDSSQ